MNSPLGWCPVSRSNDHTFDPPSQAPCYLASLGLIPRRLRKCGCMLGPFDMSDQYSVTLRFQEPGLPTASSCYCRSIALPVSFPSPCTGSSKCQVPLSHPCKLSQPHMCRDVFSSHCRLLAIGLLASRVFTETASTSMAFFRKRPVCMGHISSQADFVYFKLNMNVKRSSTASLLKHPQLSLVP